MKLKTATKILLLLFITFISPHDAVASLGELRLSLIEGDVQIKTTDTSEWAPAVINLPLRDGDQLWVPQDGRAEVEARRGTIIRLDENTSLDILTVDNDALQFYLGTGLAYVNAKGERGTTLQMDTPVSSIRVYERAKFSADVENDSYTDISVFLGAISAESRKGEIRVEAGNMLSLGEDSADLSPLGLADAWEQWNKGQDRLIEERRESVQYLPEELAGYSRDFDRNGEWVDTSYGYVWRPIVHISAGWSPYRHGRWVWIGGDYVWIAHEPWGWAPYHYGRWAHVPRHGWCWVPPARHEVYWGPGYVGWVRTPTYIAWVPLAPRETYYGHGNYGPHSINVTQVNVTNVVVKNVYKNVYVNNSVTTVDNDTFIRGQKRAEFKVKENPFLKNKISAGRPNIKPERATKIASIREIPKTKAPPAKVKNARVKELKEKRRLVKKEDKSVFMPDKTPRKMAVEKKKEPRKRSPRAERRTEKETTTVSPSKSGGSQTTPLETKGETTEQPSTLKGSKGEAEQKPQSAVKERQPAQDEDSKRELRRTTPPPAPKEEVQPTTTPKKKPQPAVEDERRPARREDSKREPRRTTPPPTPKEEGARPSTLERKPQPAVEEERRPARREDSKRELRRTTPPPTPKEEGARPSTPERKPQPAVEDERRPDRREDSKRELRRTTPPPTPKEEGARPSTLERKPQPAVEEERRPARDEGSNRELRRTTPPPAPREEVQPPPAVTKEGEEDASTLPADRKKKGKKKKPSETDPLNPDAINPDIEQR